MWYNQNMAYVTSIWTRISKSARGEFFNPLIYPFILVTFAYGVGFTFFNHTPAVYESSLYQAMVSISPLLTTVWGILAILVILIGFYVLVKDKPPMGKINCFLAFLLWFFAGTVYVLTSGWLTLFAVVVPSIYFWTWQYFSLARFRREDVLDKATMERYDDGQYDDDNGGKKLREDNRGVDESDRSPD